MPVEEGLLAHITKLLGDKNSIVAVFLDRPERLDSIDSFTAEPF